jgi:glutamyl-tRNA reductase
VLDQLLVFNLRHEARERVPTVLNSLEWQTCLRRILFLNALESGPMIKAIEGIPGVEVFRADDAYRFLLEVICGLNSPIVGETAVMGQFKEFAATARFPRTDWGMFLRQLTSNLLIDTKRVRHDHLQGIGSQSYGSLVRQHIKGVATVGVIGAGQLAREILPWLVGKTKVRVFCRNVENSKGLLEEYPEVELLPYSDENAGWEQYESALIIAAPVKADQVARWVRAQHTRFIECLDLRGEAATDPVRLATPVIKLSELFESLRAERERLASHVEAARSEITQLAQRQSQRVQFRPFGWEDLCA